MKRLLVVAVLACVILAGVVSSYSSEERSESSLSATEREEINSFRNVMKRLVRREDENTANTPEVESDKPAAEPKAVPEDKPDSAAEEAKPENGNESKPSVEGPAADSAEAAKVDKGAKSEPEKTEKREESVTEAKAPKAESVAMETSAKPCVEDDYTSVYTECDSEDKRWAVYYWKEGKTCSGGVSLPEPKKNLDCNLECAPGYFLPQGQELCSPCKAGEYSLGGGQSWSTWKAWPKEVLTDSARLEYSAKCEGWSLKDSYIESGDLSSDCYSYIKLSVYLKKPGHVKFTYMVPYSKDYHEERFGMAIRNTDCVSSSETSDEGDVIKEFPSTNGTWITHKEKLKSGNNHIYLFSSNFNDWQSLSPCKIRYLEIQGTAFHDNCFECEPGYYSAAKAEQCSACPRNHFSARGASKCLKCRDDEYAPVGSGECILKKECGTSDYGFKFDKCNSDNMWTKTYTWKTPQICLEKSIHLPDPVVEDCPPCSPGYHRVGGDCIRCGPDEYSNPDTKGACKKCEEGSTAIPGLYYHYWRTWPETSYYACYIDNDESDCASDDGWELHGTFMSSGTNHGSGVTLVYAFSFEALSKTEFRLNSTVVCKGDCTFYAYDSSMFGSSSNLLFSRNGPQPYTLDKLSLPPGYHEITLVFVKRPSTESEIDHSLDRVEVSYMEVDYTAVGGADKCTPCPDGEKTCRPCPGGTEWSSVEETCRSCQAGDFKSDRSSLSMCAKCPGGTKSEMGATSCVSTCVYSPSPNVTYDLNPLTSLVTVPGKKENLSPYTYYINVCDKSNLTSVCHTVGNKEEDKKGLTTYMCRANKVKSTFSGQTKVTKVESIGSSLSSISSLFSSSDPAKARLLSPRDLILKYSTETDDPSCDGVVLSKLVLQCDPLAVDTEPVVAKESACEFEFVWKTKYGCPLCTDADLKKVVSKCENKQKSVYYIWKSEENLCRDGVTPETQIVPCSWTDITVTDIKYIIAGVGAFVLVVLLTACCLYKKNRSLEYKYHSLLSQDESATGNVGTVPRCVDDDDLFSEDARSATSSKPTSPSKIANSVRESIRMKSFSEM
eukprot:Nk52_evm24s2578 gene=Nk52_evmTU24s2578